jgi:hypothetical protein
MSDLIRLIFGLVVDLFRSRAALEAEALVLRQQINVLRRGKPTRLTFMARRNARSKLDTEENRQSRAISWSDARPVAIMTFALSSRR